jgi:hypothetical protein
MKLIAVISHDNYYIQFYHPFCEVVELLYHYCPNLCKQLERKYCNQCCLLRIKYQLTVASVLSSYVCICKQLDASHDRILDVWANIREAEDTLA